MRQNEGDMAKQKWLWDALSSPELPAKSFPPVGFCKIPYECRANKLW